MRKLRPRATAEPSLNDRTPPLTTLGAIPTPLLWALVASTVVHTAFVAMPLVLPGHRPSAIADPGVAMQAILVAPLDQKAGTTGSSNAPSSGLTAVTMQANEVVYGVIGHRGLTERKFCRNHNLLTGEWGLHLSGKQNRHVGKLSGREKKFAHLSMFLFY